MLKTHYMARLGNQMFNYALGRIIAEQKGYELVIAPCKECGDQISPLFPNTKLPISGLSKNDNELYVGDAQAIDIENILNHDGKIVLATYGQRIEYYKNHMDKIKDWFWMDESECQKPDQDSLVIHLRLEDYSLYNLILPFEYIKQQADSIISKYKLQNKYIVTNDVHHPMVKQFIDCGYQLFHKSLKEDFIFMKNAEYLIIAQSTFSWWAGVLGTGKIYIPELEITSTHWSKHPKPEQADLRVNDPRFEYF